MKWHRVEGGYDSECGRFQIRRLYLKSSSPVFGYPWKAIDLHNHDSVCCKTAKSAKERTVQWGRRYSRQQMDEMKTSIKAR